MNNKDIDTARHLLVTILNTMDYANEIMKLHNCNDCGKKISGTCEYLPQAGQFVRFNCPLWVQEEVIRNDISPLQVRENN